MSGNIFGAIDAWRFMKLAAKAADETEVEFERALRFISALAILVEAESKGAAKESERTQ